MKEDILTQDAISNKEKEIRLRLREIERLILEIIKHFLLLLLHVLKLFVLVL